MGSLRNVVLIFVLVAVLAVTIGHSNHQASHQNQVRIRRQAAEEAAPEEVAQENPEPEDAAQENQLPEANEQENQETDDDQANEEEGSTPDNQDEDGAEDNPLIALGFPFWTTCNYTVDPIKSCYDCNRLLICKRIGGLVKRCGNPFRPHCNNGTCSPNPSDECA